MKETNMTKKIEMNNTFATALNTRYETCIKLDKLSEKNRKSLTTFRDECNNSDVIAAFLTSAALDTRCFENDVYEIDKVRNLTLLLTDKIALRDFNEMTRLVFMTAYNFEKAELAFTRQDAFNSCSAHIKIADKQRKALTVQHRENKSDSTCTAQHRSSLNALLDLNVIRSINKSEFRVNLNAEITKSLLTKLTKLNIS